MRACLGKFKESCPATLPWPLTSMMSRFTSDARVSVVTGDQQQRVIKKRKQDDINITVNGLYSGSDRTLMAHKNEHMYAHWNSVLVQIHLYPLSSNDMCFIVGCLSATLCFNVSALPRTLLRKGCLIAEALPTYIKVTDIIKSKWNSEAFVL